MAADGSRASWHPAFMPNSASGVSAMAADDSRASWHPAFMPNFPSNASAPAAAKEPDATKEGDVSDAAHVGEGGEGAHVGVAPAPQDSGETETLTSEATQIPDTVADLRQVEPAEAEAQAEAAADAQADADAHTEVPVRAEADPARKAESPDADSNALFDGDGAAEETAHDLPDSVQEDDDVGIAAQPGEESSTMASEDVAAAVPQDLEHSTKTHKRPESFARTAQDLNFANDDEFEFSPVPQADSNDLDRFISPSDRSSSFPGVPRPTDSATDTDSSQLPQTSPAPQELKRASEGGFFDDPHQDGQDDFFGPASAQSGGLDMDMGGTGDKQGLGNVSIVGDIFGREDEDEARFEEGMPLIRHETEEVAAEAKPPVSHGLLAGAATSTDGFFDTSDATATMLPPALERKSTEQATGFFGRDPSSPTKSSSGTPSGESELADTDEDDQNSPCPDDIASKTNNDGSGNPGFDDSPSPAAHISETKWDQMLANDDDFLDDENLEGAATPKELDPTDLFGSDDEGFLEDEPTPASVAAPAARPPSTHAPPARNRYMPQTQPTPATHQPPPYTIPGSTGPALAAVSPFIGAQAIAPGIYGQRASLGPPAFPHAHQYPLLQPPSQAPPMAPRAESFADKSKGGYSSPYDIPLDLVKTRKPVARTPRSPHVPDSTTPPQPGPSVPPSVASMAPPPPPQSQSTTSLQGQPPSLNRKAPPPPLKSGAQGFFEELPVSRSRPVSRAGRTSPSKPHAAPFGHAAAFMASPPPNSAPAGVMMSPTLSSVTSAAAPPPPFDANHAAPATSQSQVNSRYAALSAVASLVAPEKVSPYTPMTAHGTTPGNTIPPATSRYSPASTPHAPASVPPPLNRYSPGSASHRAAPHSLPASTLTHLPRTSSPLANFEVSHDKQPQQHGLLPSSLDSPDRNRSVSAYEPRLHRIGSLPPTREEEEDEQKPAHTLGPEQTYALPPRGTPPPRGPRAHATLSPPKRARANHAPLPQREPGFAPPVRSQTMSPGGSLSKSASQDPAPRPSSVHSAQPPPQQPVARQSSNISYAPPSRPRGISVNYGLVPPTDGQELDPLQRWKGAPVFTWGVGGALVTSFPKDVPRYTSNQPTPMVVRGPGEVKIRNMRDVCPLDDMLMKFPGPLKNKSKKKETLAWLTSGIETLEMAFPDYSVWSNLSHENKRDRERVLLWKMVRVFVENDGVLEGNATIDASVRAILAPEARTAGTPPSGYPSMPMSIDPGLGVMSSEAKADSVDPTSLDTIRKLLVVGDRENAVWAAADKRLWGHAMLIANTVSPELYGKVTHEFVRKEVHDNGRDNESLAALYEVLAGNFEECVGELVPAHAMAGVQMMTTNPASRSQPDDMAGLDKWQETLCLILSNRRADDVRAIKALGRLLSQYNRAEAAHVCFLFARSVSVFTGLDDAHREADFVLVGSDHPGRPDQVAKDIPALLLSEAYEFGLTLTGSSATAAGCPHLTGYKLQHALTLAEHGQRDRALAYCDAMTFAITSQTRRSPYHHALLEGYITELATRLRQAPKSEAGGWMSKPSMNKVSDSVWTRFNKFVAGDEGDAGATTGDHHGGGEQGPFSHITGTPSISRSPSMDNFSNYNSAAAMGAGGGVAGYGMGPTAPLPSAAATAATATATTSRAGGGSRYTPSSAQGGGSSQGNAPCSPPVQPSTGRSSGEHMRHNPYEPSPLANSRPASSYAPPQPHANGHTPSSYTPHSSVSSQNQSPRMPPGPTLPPAAAASDSAYTPGSRASQSSQPWTPGVGNPYYLPYGSPAQSPMACGATAFALVTTTTSASASNGPSEPGSATGVDCLSQGISKLSFGGYLPPTPDVRQDSGVGDGNAGAAGYEAPSFQPYTFSYDPPSYQPSEPDPEDGGDDDDKPKPKKKSFMDDDDGDDDGFPGNRKSADKSRGYKEREAQEAFRKAAEEDAKRHTEQQPAKRGWGFGGWFSGSKKESVAPEAKKASKVHLGDANSFVYDARLKRWIDKNNPDAAEGPKSAAPPPRLTMRSVSSASGLGSLDSPPNATRPPPPGPSASVPPPRAMGTPMSMAGDSLAPPPALGGAPLLSRSVSNTSLAGSRPGTSMSNASSIEDLLAAGPKRGGPKKKKRYVDVIAGF